MTRKAPKTGPEVEALPFDFESGSYLSPQQQSFGEIYNKLRQLAEDNRQEPNPQRKYSYALHVDELDALMTGLSALIEENQKLLDLTKNTLTFDIDAILKGTTR